jgi:hypothetical protein
MLFNLVGLRSIANRVIKGPVRDGLGDAAGLAQAALVLAMGLLLVRFLYNRKIFLKI